MFSLMKYTAIILKKYTSSILSVYLEYTSIHVGKLHGVYFKYYIFRTIKYTLSILPFFVLISILEVYFSAYCLSLFSSVYLKYTSVHCPISSWELENCPISLGFEGKFFKFVPERYKYPPFYICVLK